MGALFYLLGIVTGALLTIAMGIVANLLTPPVDRWLRKSASSRAAKRGAVSASPQAIGTTKGIGERFEDPFQILALITLLTSIGVLSVVAAVSFFAAAFSIWMTGGALIAAEALPDWGLLVIAVAVASLGILCLRLGTKMFGMVAEAMFGIRVF